MQKPETKFRAKIRPLLDAIPNSWWESIQQKSIRGTPDIIGCLGGYFIALELKSKKVDAKGLQAYKLQSIRDAYGVALVVHPENWKEVYDYLRSLIGGPNETKTIND